VPKRSFAAAARLRVALEIGLAKGHAVGSCPARLLRAAGTLTVESTRPDFQGGGAPITTKVSDKKS
jgi:hypothetical protein